MQCGAPFPSLISCAPLLMLRKVKYAPPSRPSDARQSTCTVLRVVCSMFGAASSIWICNRHALHIRCCAHGHSLLLPTASTTTFLQRTGLATSRLQSGPRPHINGQLLFP